MREARAGTGRRLDWPLGEWADPPGFDPGVSRFEAWAASNVNAFVAPVVERLPGTEKAGSSNLPEGSR